MELTLHKPGDHNYIRSGGPRGVMVVDTLYRNSLLLSVDCLVTGWPVRSMDELDEERIQPIFDLEPEIVILGTGEKQAFPPPRLLVNFYEKGIGIEAMTTEAACRTFNVLISENRNAVAALIIS